MSHNRRQSRMAQDQPRRTLAQVLGEHRKGITPEDLFKTAGFDLAHVDDFYAELRSLQSRLTEQRPPKGEERRWPNGSHILIRLKGK